MNTNGLFCTTTVSGTSWSREWKNSSGGRVWLEQGGIQTTKTVANHTVTLPKSFSDTNYSVQLTYKAEDQAISNGGLDAHGYTTTSFVLEKYSADEVVWWACGK